MSEQVELTDPVEHSVGGFNGHLFRRVFHLSMSFIPLVYFEYGDKIADSVNLEVVQVVSGLTLLLIIVEGLRLKIGFTIFGQRDYESKQVSALAWGGLAVGLTFLTLSEYPELVWPLILSLSLGDPFLGEVRRKGYEPRAVFLSGSLFLLAIWIICWNQLSTPLWLGVLLAPICVAAEWPRLRWIDDNATMLLIPLAAVIMVLPWL